MVLLYQNIAYMGDDYMFQLHGKYQDMALAVRNPCHLNMAACLIKLKRYHEAIGHCNIVLTEEEKNPKALFRRGKAKAELGQPVIILERHKSMLRMTSRSEESYEQLQSKRKLCTKSIKKCTKEYYLEGGKKIDCRIFQRHRDKAD